MEIFIFCAVKCKLDSLRFLVQLNNRNTRTMCEICSKYNKTPEQRQWLTFMVYFGNNTSENRADFSVYVL